MKIEQVSVFDPRDYGLFERPIITVLLQEELFPSSDEVVFFGNGQPGAESWASQRYGPFVRYECRSDSGKNYAGYYNRALSDHYPPIVDVRVYVQHKSPLHVQEGNFALPLKRARQYLRQYDVPWRLLMNDHDGQKGLASWTPVQREVTCKFMICKSDDQTCDDLAVQTVFTQGIDFPLCEEHLPIYNEGQKLARQSSR